MDSELNIKSGFCPLTSLVYINGGLIIIIGIGKKL